MAEFNEKVVLILEKSSTPVEIIDKKDFRMGGNAAIFGKENENHRIYEEDEYFPHLEYLQEKIKKRKLAGELDHPEKFDTSLKNISHIIEKMWYDKESRTLKCELKLLDTDPHGLNARKLVEAGFPLSLSSRAAGVVGKDKKVKIKRIFAYDLVADGGFGDDAELARVNEDLEKYTLQDYTTTGLTMINEELGIDSSTLEIYDVTDRYPELLKEGADFSKLDEAPDEKNSNIEKIYKNKNNTTMSQPVSVEEMYKYSKVVKEKIEEMMKEITSLNERIKLSEDSNKSGLDDPGNKKSPDELAGLGGDMGDPLVDPEVEKLKATVTELEEAQKSIKEKVDKLVEYAEIIATQSNNGVDYSENLAEHIQANRDYTERVGKILNDNINYTENIGDILNKSINYSERTSETVNQMVDHSDVIVEQLNNVINYADKIGGKLNEIINYADYIGEKQNMSINYTEAIAENSVVKEDFNQFIAYTEEMVGANEKDGNREEGKTSILENYKTLGNKIEAVLENLKTQKEEVDISEKYPFIKDLDEKAVEKFSSLNEAQKTKVEKLISNEEGKLEESKIDEILVEATNPDHKFITEMPEEYRTSWESLNEADKGLIVRRSQLYNLDSEYQIRNFWRNQKLEKFETELNENKQVKKETKEKEVPALGYSSEMINMVGKGLDRY